MHSSCTLNDADLQSLMVSVKVKTPVSNLSRKTEIMDSPPASMVTVSPGSQSSDHRKVS